ncbi:MAG: Cation efflux system protein CusB, partial [Candidatus Anoxychlamydiales bacterium]|nr:Cation efflux system protein CusB [Candidatus Anoxychlamydiales bacterium]
MFYKQLIFIILLFFNIFAHAADKVPGYAPVEIDPERLQLYGVTSEIVEMRDLTKTIRTVGIVTVDERRISNIQTKFNGWIEKLYVNFTNEYVKEGDPLFQVYSPELLSTQEEYLLALKGAQRKIEGRFSEEL